MLVGLSKRINTVCYPLIVINAVTFGQKTTATIIHTALDTKLESSSNTQAAEPTAIALPEKTTIRGRNQSGAVRLLNRKRSSKLQQKRANNKMISVG
jgi:hypothetical protein